MKNLTNQLIAFFLLLCFAVTIVPLNFIHQHSHSHTEEAHCDVNYKIHSDDACHISLYHNQLEEKHCDHKSHFTAYEANCDLCDMLNTQRKNYCKILDDSEQVKKYYSILAALKFECHQQLFSDLVFNKGSPIKG